MQYTEAPIPPYYVVVENDGCHRGNVDNPEAWGTVDQCAQFIANHLPPKGCDSFGIVSMETGRQVSFMIPQPTVQRRIRLHWQDLA